MIATVVFKNKNGYGEKQYEYFISRALDAKVGEEYHITVDNGYDYEGAVVKLVSLDRVKSGSPIGRRATRTITKLEPAHETPRKKIPIDKVIFNTEKGITVVRWRDGSITKLHCAPNEEWDEEKALALCVLKHICGDKSYFNDYLREWMQKAERH
jgi:hypothetical protein